jgi:LysM repeat protein
MSNIRRNTRSRRANIRLARTLVVLSLTTVFGAGFAMQAGAGSKVVPTKAGSFVVVTVAPGETIWSVAKALNDGGDVRQLVDEIIKVNGLDSSDLAAGSKIRVPLN